MALMKRTARTQAAAPAAKQEATPRRAIMRRSVREATAREVDLVPVKQAILDDLKSIAKHHAVIDSSTAAIAESTARIEALMKEHKLPPQTDGKLLAELVDQYTKESRTIDPQRFYNSVHEDDFWPCISVSITEAKKVMAEKELDKIATKIPAKLTGTIVKIKEFKTETKRKAK